MTNTTSSAVEEAASSLYSSPYTDTEFASHFCCLVNRELNVQILSKRKDGDLCYADHRVLQPSLSVSLW